MAVKIEYYVYDNDGDSATTEANVESGLTLAQYQEYAEAKALLIEPLILGYISPAATLKVPIDVSALTSNVAVESSDVEQISAFEFIDADGNRKKVNIPATVETQIAVGSDSLDLTNVAVAAFIAAMEDGIDIGDSIIIQPTTHAGEDIVATLFGRAETRNSGRRR